MPFDITIERTFSAAHQLRLADGSLEPLHGHDWRVRVSVSCDELDACDCVMDFHDLHRQLDAIISPWAHRHLNEVEPFRSGVNTSAERVARVVAGLLRLPDRVRLAWVSVREAPGCVATYRP
jgi:6-pyruvoyltetrahydropterin/6-carboxytetrahydropterin synthase